MISGVVVLLKVEMLVEVEVLVDVVVVRFWHL